MAEKDKREGEHHTEGRPKQKENSNLSRRQRCRELAAEGGETSIQERLDQRGWERPQVSRHYGSFLPTQDWP